LSESFLNWDLNWKTKAIPATTKFCGNVKSLRNRQILWIGLEFCGGRKTVVPNNQSDNSTL